MRRDVSQLYPCDKQPLLDIPNKYFLVQSTHCDQPELCDFSNVEYILIILFGKHFGGIFLDVPNMDVEFLIHSHPVASEVDIVDLHMQSVGLGHYYFYSNVKLSAESQKDSV
jgi:hypothetical protein